jgi:hypothetical protein
MSRYLRSALGTKVSENKMRVEAHDDIQSILRHTGMFTPHLERMLQVSSEMREMEWRMLRRAASVPTCAIAPSNRSGD